MNTKIDIVITRHRPLVDLLIERGLITTDTPVLEHASASDVSGKHVLGVLPHHLSSKCASITEVPMTGLTQADREAMTSGDLGLERTREVAGDPVTYQVFGGKYRQERSQAIGLAAASREHRGMSPDHHLAVALLVHGRLLMGEASWGHRWAEAENTGSPTRRRAVKAAIAARAQIPYDVMGPNVYGEVPASGVMSWQTSCGHCMAEADMHRGLFRAWSSGPGYTPWIDVETLRLYDSPEDFDAGKVSP